ncbi:PREDICTED: stimulator of interferon genes protein-like [Priapulus caudatus]|uniref:Stimulator of interferon genes protein-like n=1 Tax=Priapulus caudatus TaxID=37621 RepID=A0ABM1EDH6_PRICU|nr:PREDICTED: stimulator of interferon genes protein-like [Priapulus caudatus]
MSLGEGLAYNYYAGYLNLVLPSVADRISSSEYDKSTTNKKLFILIPANGEMPGKQQDVDKSIRQVGTLAPLMIDRAGFKRKYHNNVYGSVHNEKEVTFVADMPADLLTLRDMTEDFELTGFTEQDKLREVQKYAASLTKILERQSHLAGTYEIVVYNGNSVLKFSV